MLQYSFTTYWSFEAPLEKVWNEIRAMDRWPEWWKYVKSVGPLQGTNEDDIGSTRSIEWTTALPYTISFSSELIEIDNHKKIAARVYGELEGIGIWAFESKDGLTIIRYDWQVKTTKKWMNILAPIAKPIFNWNHDKVMKAGYEGLKKRLFTTILR